MTRDEIIDLLTVAAAFDQRTVGSADVAAWSAVLGEYGFGAARDAMFAHYREQTRRVMPADIRQGIRASSRRDSVPVAALPIGAPDEPNQEFIQARDAMIARMAERDAKVLTLSADSAERAGDWLSRHLGPAKPAGPPITVTPSNRWTELPGDPPELRGWLAAKRRHETAGAN